MVFLPIVGRELSVAARRRGTVWARVLPAGVTIAIALWMFLSSNSSGSTTSQTSSGLFVALSWVCFIYALFVGVWFTADSLAEEKREGTLGLLFLTDLKGYDVVLGKMVAHSVPAVYALCAVAPILAIPLLAGGVSPGEYGRVTVVLGNTLFFSLVVGMTASTLVRLEQTAMMLTGLAAILTAAIFPWLSLFAKPGSWTDLGLRLASPGFQLVQAFDAAYLPPPGATPPSSILKTDFWRSVIVVNSLGWFCLLFACFAVARGWEEGGSARPGVARLREQFRSLFRGNPLYRKLARRHLLEGNPIAWLNSRNRIHTGYVWAVFAGLGLLWCWGYRENGREWLSIEYSGMCLVIANTVLKFWVASESGRYLVRDWRSGALELLLVTPLPVREILRGHFMGLARRFGGPVLVVLVLHLVFLDIELRNFSQGSDRTMNVVIFVGLAFVLLLDLFSLGWIVLMLGMRGKRPGLASLGGLWRIMLLPWLIVLVLGLMGFISQTFRDATGLILLFLIVFVANDLFFIGLAASRLNNNFREMAARPAGFARGHR